MPKSNQVTLEITALTRKHKTQPNISPMCFTVVAGHNHIEIRLPFAPLLPSSKPILFMDKYESTSDISTSCVPLFPTQAMLPFVTTVQVCHAGVHAGYLAVAIFFRWKQHLSHTNCA
jgi:hypothetical protein